MSFPLPKLETFPTLPGVYIMKSQNGTVLYVGKANNLKQRVRQYFLGGDGRAIIPFLISKVAEIDTIIVTSEKEALLLENNLIKKHQPTYNALLKDDKSYIALKVNTRHPWPMVQLVRYKGKPTPDGLYFGPYTSAHSARTTLDLIQRIFPLRQCSDQELIRRTRPCILYDMKRCIAPCVGKCTKEEYNKYVDASVRFLKGQDKEILKELYEEMTEYAETLEFEKADQILKKIRQIESTIEGQHVDKPLGGDSDAIAIFRQAEEVIVIRLFIRNGKLIGSRHNNFTRIAEDDEELLANLLLQQYSQQEELPDEILLPIELADADALTEILSANKKRRLKITCPARGDKRALVEMAYLNAEATFKKEKNLQSIREKTLLDMQEKFRLKNYPKRIECFDNSNISGKEAVSALIVFTEGEKDKKRYRKYKIRTVDTPDDYATMHEVLTRRYKRGKEENDLPDLLIVDGGKGHLNIAIKVLHELNIITVDVIGVAKEQGRHDKGITQEQIFLPNIKDPILLKHHSPILFLLQQIRDEAHRFAITFHRQKRSKKMLSSALLDIPGIGAIKTRKLLKAFGSLQGVLAATREQLEQVQGLSKANIEAILIIASPVVPVPES